MVLSNIDFLLGPTVGLKRQY